MIDLEPAGRLADRNGPDHSVLAGLSLRSLSLGLVIAFLSGCLVGFLTPSLKEPIGEMLARGGPDLLDLAVAFAAGLAAAYASSRASLIAALPGVAIAAALVPPIAPSGLALSLGEFGLAANAMLLLPGKGEVKLGHLAGVGGACRVRLRGDY